MYLYLITFRETPLEKEMATHSSILAWRSPWTEKPGGLQFRGLKRVRHDWATVTHSGGRPIIFPGFKSPRPEPCWSLSDHFNQWQPVLPVMVSNHSCLTYSYVTVFYLTFLLIRISFWAGTKYSAWLQNVMLGKLLGQYLAYSKNSVHVKYYCCYCFTSLYHPKEEIFIFFKDWTWAISRSSINSC